MRTTLPAWLMLACALGALSTAAAASDTDTGSDLPWKRGGIYLGGFLNRYDSTVRLGSEAAGLGLEVNLEDALGLDTKTQDVRVGGYWRFGETSRHKVSLDWIKSDRSASKVLEEDITVGDTTFTQGTKVGLESSLSILRASYSYSFIMDERLDLSAAFGLYTMPFSFKFQGVSSSESSDFTAPLPVVGLHADIAITPEFFLKQSVDLFYLEYGGYTGSLADIYLGVEWYPWKHLGIGLGFESFRLGIEADGQEIDLEGNVKYAQNGLFGYLTYAF
ncbi:MAG: hypothetical protein NTY35_09985 [Planctomycetota bacterium]|nr:hypothetical protein [Planctomycetota bacterium]